MATIIKLDDRLSNMIAAGEVVTRPANALKEMIENAIDAKSTRIDVYLQDNGLSEIRVTDNGIGMDKEDIHLAFLRHATSKIKNEFDLAHIHSLGFRGEAIPAIASVSKMQIVSKTKDSMGYQVTYDGGKLKDESSYPISQGTIVSVKNLFFNVPARLKYIKSPQSELAYLVEVVDEMMLSHPEIAFTLTHDTKSLRQSFGDLNYQNIFMSIYGKEVSNELLSFQKSFDFVDLNLHLVKPSVTRARKNDIYIFINGRSIKNYLLINSVVEGYHTRLMQHRYPIAIIDIQMDASLLDVNVHPQKREIKLSNEYQVANWIREAISLAFTTKPQTIPTPLSETKYEKYSGFDLVAEALTLELEEPTPTHFDSISNRKLPDMDYIGSYHGTYLLFQNEIGLYMIDQHAAAERIRYERIYERLGSVKVDRKGLLTPIQYTFKPSEKTILDNNKTLIESYGIVFDSLDGDLFLREIPAWLEDKDIDYMIYSMIEELRDYERIDLKRLRDQLAKDISCKGAIKSNKPLSMLEIDSLFKGLQACENPYLCPHGRPVVISFTPYEIDKLFKRIV